MTHRETYLTSDGLKRLKQELEHLRTVRRREMAESLKKALELGRTADNAEYEDAKQEQARVEGRIIDLGNLLHSAVLISHTVSSETVQMGSSVVVKDRQGREVRYTIVGSTEADPLHGRISNESPVGRALLGQRKGEEAEAKTPAGLVKYTILAVE